MEIDTRFPTAQVNQAGDVSAGEISPAPPALVDSGSKFFISPVLRFDSRSLTVIFQVRDSISGDVVRQFPSEAVVARYRQDPTAKPFVLPSSRGDGEAAEIKLSGSEDPAPRATVSVVGNAPASSPAGSTEPPVTASDQPVPIDLVA